MDRSADEIFAIEWPKIEGSIRTLARKMAWLPGVTEEDLMQEFRIEAYQAAKWWNPEKSAWSSFAWQRILKRRADIFSHFNSQKRDFKKEGSFTEVDNIGVDEFGEGSSNSVVVTDSFAEEIRETIGNSGRFSQILMLDSVDKIGKLVLILIASGYNYTEVVEIVREKADPDFDYGSWTKLRRKLGKNSELHDLLDS